MLQVPLIYAHFSQLPMMRTPTTLGYRLYLDLMAAFPMRLLCKGSINAKPSRMEVSTYDTREPNMI